MLCPLLKLSLIKGRCPQDRGVGLAECDILVQEVYFQDEIEIMTAYKD
jgi:hypothetical protein